MEAIERIKGYCTEVTQAQWEELVRVADEVGVLVSRTFNGSYTSVFGDIGNSLNAHRSIKVSQREGLTAIPFPDFIAKLRGEWMPKTGEMVEVRKGPTSPWISSTFVGRLDGWNVCRTEDDYDGFIDEHIRPLRPTITRAEAERQLGKRIID